MSFPPRSQSRYLTEADFSGIKVTTSRTGLPIRFSTTIWAMFLTKKHLSRRTFLKGAGVSLALPFLDAMVPAATALSKTAAAKNLRAGFFYLPHGMIMNNTVHGPAMDRWTPSGDGQNFKLNVITKSLEPYQKYLTFAGNIKNDEWTGTQHILNPATWLSGMRPKDLSTPSMCATLDQVMADHLAKDTPLRSLQVASEGGVPTGAANPAPYLTLSFRDPSTPLPMEFDPHKVFIRLFGDDAGGQTAKENESLLDLIKDQTQAMKRDLSTSDRAILDDYLTSVRKAEKDVQSQRKRDLRNTKLELPPNPKEPLDDFDKQVRLMFELIALAYEADLTRVVSFMMAMERTNRTYPHIGVPDSFHAVSHHANDIDRINKLVKIQTWHMERFAEFLARLATVREGDGTLLDRSMFLYGSNMSNSDQHNNHPLPALLVGGAIRNKEGGRLLALPQPTPIANLHVSLLNKAGIEQRTFGDSTGAVTL